MNTDRINRAIASLFVLLVFPGSFLGFFPAMVSLQTLFTTSDAFERIVSFGLLELFAIGYVLNVGYMAYLAGTLRHPIRLWTGTITYNLVLSLIGFSFGAGGDDFFVLFGVWTVALTLLGVVAWNRERDFAYGTV